MVDDLKKVLVTGASGFLGASVAARCEAAGIPVVRCSLSGRSGVACDLTDDASTRALLRSHEPAAVVHCAAKVPKSNDGYGNVEAAAASTAMTRILAAAANCPIVFASSMTVYESELQMPVSEDRARKPEHAYAQGKWESERALLARGGAGDTAFRFPGLFGMPRRSGLLFNAIRSFVVRGTFELNAPPVLWAAMHVDDAAEYVVRAVQARTPWPSAPVNVGYLGEFSIPGAMAKIANLCGASWRPVPQKFPVFSANLSRLRDRFGLLAATFDQRLAELVALVRTEAASAPGSFDA